MLLNKYQQAFVDLAIADDPIGPVVLEACPGSGKTKSVESLVAAMLENGQDPMRILALTFTRKASAEMRKRIAQTLWPEEGEATIRYFETLDPEDQEKAGIDRYWLEEDTARLFLVEQATTIHAICYRLLKKLGFKFRVLSGKAQWATQEIVKDGLAEMGWKEGPKAVFHWFSLAIRNLITPDQARSWYERELIPYGLGHRAADLATLYKRYYFFCKQRNLIDFDMMQARLLHLIRTNPKVLKRLQGAFDAIIVDEAQDTSAQQSEILFALAGEAQNIVFVGDVDQSMYKFRGAEPRVLREDFTAIWPQARRFCLPINYRSTKAIVDAAAALIGYNYEGGQDDSQYLKPFDYGPNAQDGSPLGYVQAEHFQGLVEEVVAMVKDNPGDWFILSRTRAECAAIHVGLVAQNIPAVNHSGGLLFGSPHIKKVVAYAQLGCNYQEARDNLEILGEVANVASAQFKAPMDKRRHLDTCKEKRPWVDCGCPLVYEEGVTQSAARFYGKKAIQDAGGWKGIISQTYQKNKGGYPTLRSKGARDFVEFVTRIEYKQDSAQEALRLIINDCVLPWLAHQEGISPEDLAENGKVEDFDVLLSLIEPGQTLEEFLRDVDDLAGRATDSPNGEAVSLGTFHWSKGAESPRVIVNLTRCPIIPPQRQKDQLPMGKPPEIEEERRLAFVGITRAKQECVVVSAQEWQGQKLAESQFVGELLAKGFLAES